MFRSPLTLLATLGLCLVCLTSCVSIERTRQRMAETPLAPLPGASISPEAIDGQLELAQREQEQGLFWEAVRRLLRLRKQRFLTPEQGDRVQLSMEAAMLAGCERATKPVQLERFTRKELPRRPRAIHSVRMAELLLERGQGYDAFDELRELEFVHPTHHLRSRSADLIFEVGMSLLDDHRRVLWLLPARHSDRAPEVLDFLVLRHPNHPGCAQAYWVLAQIYERKQDYPKAIGRLEDLITFHANSDYALEAELRIPELRLISRLRLDTDRPALVRAYGEALRWYGSHSQVLAAQSGGQELVERCEQLLLECNARLAQYDLSVAQFYRTVEEPAGAELHALRALGYLEQVVLEEEQARAETLLAWATEAKARLGAEAPPAPLLPEPAPASESPTPLDSTDVESPGSSPNGSAWTGADSIGSAPRTPGRNAHSQPRR
ncbi:MAG: outer membrane protein assembly factor BamD [Planctomycetota bacterium]|jgi:hypothetical protein